MSNRAPNDYALGHNHDELQRHIGQSRFLGELTEELLLRGRCLVPRRLVGGSCSVVGVDRSAIRWCVGAQALGAGREKEGKLSSAACELPCACLS